MRKLALFAASFAAATVLCCYGVPLSAVLWLGCFCALLALACLLLRGKRRTLGLLLTLGAAWGFLWFSLWTALFVTPALSLADTTASVTATVTDYPAPTKTGVSVALRLEDGTPVLLYLRGTCEAAPGDTLSVTADFLRADRMFGEENRYHSARGVFLTAYAEAEDAVLTPCDRTPPRYLPLVWANGLKEGIAAAFPQEHAALLHAVTLGDKSGLSDGTVSLFNRSGLSHLLVVSGLHMSILLWGLTRLFARRKRLSALLGLVFLVLFTLLVGSTPSAIRAAVMNALVLLAPTLRRETDPPTSLGAALLLLLLQNPYAAAGVSLQLSFASVAGILLVADPLYRRLTASCERLAPAPWVRRALALLWGSLSASLGAMLFTTPLIALWFGVISLLSPLSNLLCLWAAALLLAGGLLSGLLTLLAPALAAPFVFLTSLVCRYTLWVAEWVGSLSFAALSLEHLYYRLWLLAVYAGLALLFLPRRRKRPPLRPVLPLCSAVLLLCAAIVLTRLTYTAPPLTVTVLDVGQGASAAFHSEGCTALVDCGGSGADSAGDVAADYFQSLGLSTLDLLILTHLHDDHFNGVETLFARMEIGTVLLPGSPDETDRLARLEELAREEGAQLHFISERTTAALGGCSLTLYPPLGSGTSNEEGLFVLCSAGHFDTLITGDADSAIEAMLVKYYDLPDTELLLVGHHGSAGSTSDAFLEAIRPEYAVISVGHNSYGHPRPEVLERLARAGAEIYRTDLHGSVTLSVSADGNIMD